MRNGFITQAVLFGIAAIIVAGSFGVYLNNKVESNINQVFGATILPTSISDTIGTFRTNVNTSLNNLNEALSFTTSTDPGHKHTTSSVTGTFGVASGGTGQSSLTANNVILGNGASAVQFVAPGTTGNVLTSDGTTWSSSAPQTSQTAYGNEPGVADATIVKGRVVIAINLATTTVANTNQGNTGTLTFGRVAANIGKVEQTWIATSTAYVSKVIIPFLSTSGSPSDNLVVTLRQTQDGTGLASTTIAATSLTGSMAAYEFTFPTPYPVIATQTYRIELSRSGALSNTDYYQLGVQSVGTYSSGTMPVYNGTTWSAGTEDAGMIIKTTEINGRYRHALPHEASSTLLGVSQANASSGDTVVPIFFGPVTGLSSLSLGSNYYLTGNDGVMSTSTATSTIGFAVSSTVLYVDIKRKTF